MKNYIVLYSTVTGKATVHDSTCPTVNGKTPKACVPCKVDAETSERAAAQFYTDEDFAAKGLPMPKVCNCAKR